MKRQKDRVAEMIEQGAALQIIGTEDVFTLAGLLWVENDTVARWVAIFPVHQGHISHTTFDRAEFFNGTRDVALFNGNKMVVYITPIEESPLNTDEAVDALANWRDLVGQGSNARYFNDFLKNA